MSARSHTILVVDDDPRLVRFVKANLESVGYRVLSASDARLAIEVTEVQHLDLIILDVMLPDMNGFELCRRIRDFSSTPIIMLTAKGGEDDKVTGLRLGADDYVTKPFGVKELLARVDAVLRRTRFPEELKSQPVLQLGDLTIDLGRRLVQVAGEEVRLTATEYKLLQQLATNKGRVMLHEELLKKVWGPEYNDETDYLRVYIRRLRQKLGDDPRNPRYIVSRSGIGYLFQEPSAATEPASQPE